MLDIREGEVVLQETDLKNAPLNERSAQRYPVNTVLDFTGTCTLAKKEGKNGSFLIIYALRNGKDARIPAGMLLRAPFKEENREPMKDKTTLQTALLGAIKAPNPGAEVWPLLKGHKVKVLEDVSCQDTPFGKTEEEPVKFNIFDYAD